MLFDCVLLILYLYMLNFFYLGKVFVCIGNVYLNIMLYDSFLMVGVDIFLVVGNNG